MMTISISINIFRLRKRWMKPQPVQSCRKEKKINLKINFKNQNFCFQDGEMFILGLLKEQRQEEVYRERFNQE